MEFTYTHQKSSDKTWIDEAGQSIPYSRITKVERLQERHAVKIAKEAITAHKYLKKLYTIITECSNEAYEAYMASKNIDKKPKKNFTWFNFDRSIKIEISISEPIVFDDLTILAAKIKLDEFLNNNISSKIDLVKEMAIDTFKTKRNGKLDPAQVLRLTQYESKVKDPLFSEAVSLIREAIRKPKSKTYKRVWLKNETGKYECIDLNMSSIDKH